MASIERKRVLKPRLGTNSSQLGGIETLKSLVLLKFDFKTVVLSEFSFLTLCIIMTVISHSMSKGGRHYGDQMLWACRRPSSWDQTLMHAVPSHSPCNLFRSPKASLKLRNRAKLIVDVPQDKWQITMWVKISWRATIKNKVDNSTNRAQKAQSPYLLIMITLIMIL